MIVYAIYFLYRNQESEKRSNDFTTNTIKSFHSNRASSSIRPPPPNHPPPRAPLSPNSSQYDQSGANNSRYPLLAAHEINEHHLAAQVCYPCVEKQRS